MSFRILNQAPQFLLANGKVNAGGSLTFYLTDLSTPQSTWSDEALTTLNSNPVVMDAAGRTLTDVWGADAEYGVVMKDAQGATIWTRNNVRGASDPSAVLPNSGTADTFLMWDGAAYILQPVLQVPDPTGLSNYQLVSDGTAVPLWQQIPEAAVAPTPEYAITAAQIRIGTLLQQWGTGTVPAASGAQTASVAVTFATAFSATPYVALPVLTNAGGSTSSGRLATLAVTNLTTTGMTVTADVSDDDTQSQYKMANTTPFSYFVIGPTVVP